MMDTINYSMEGTVFDIQRFSIHDGPGIRTIVFLKGCPLSCLWCSNPESQKIKPVIMYQSANCIHCGRCISACKIGAISVNNKGFINREICTACGECSNVCPTSSLVLKGKKMTIEQVIKELKKDAINYRRSGGGITLSGGEPLLQSDFSKELFKACKAQGWHTAIETTGYANSETIEKVFPYIDLVLMDIKSTNLELHRKYTGVSNEIILNNAKRISEISKMVVRVPLIPDFNSSIQDILELCRFTKTLNNIDTIHLLPYHTYGENKYELLGRDYLMKDSRSLKEDEIEVLKKIIEDQGIKCIIGG
ncbi:MULTISPECIES: glycyl-radical enzyme activating protein [Clostridium]|uniref:Glycyl-radical enzyme activating protein n=2 Tax=Clostridium TaxID=1485 RepID=A0A1S9ND23_CLOBE|nr:pyruvate formate lyase activating enzyme [Clostridium beijerinckii]POO91091.1 glycyl-radical enzyme activating protein [Clostridium sp. 2-1]MZK50330.1 glycyl-radical enzyme activating protein [Clostridium beijerinckii]MZK58413.1 glycyl-radical enzyme activating protein [Clostridium beijerinckii]MZK68535.1 glycyl-radical enzyme activating protein [Clostridium beijerinckii]